MKDRRRRFFKSLKRFARFVLLASILLTGFLFYQSVLGASASAAFSNAVKEVVKELFDVNDVIAPNSVGVTQLNVDKKYYYAYERIKLPISTIPRNASKEFSYEFDCEGCSVDEEGYFTYTGVNDRTVYITVTSVHNPEAKARFYLHMRGIAPTSESVEGVRMDFYNVQGTKRYESDELLVGKQYLMRTVLTVKDEYLEEYGLTQKEILAMRLPYRLALSGDITENDYQFDSTECYLTFYKPYSGDLTFRFRKEEAVFFEDISDSAHATVTMQLNAREDPSFDYKPKKPLVPNVGKYDAANDEYVVTVAAGREAIAVYGSGVGGNTNPMCYLSYRDEESKKVARVNGRYTLYRNVNKGVCNLEMVSVFDEALRTKVKVIFEGYTPKRLTVYGEREITPGSKVQYYGEYEKRLFDEGKIVWSIVEGNDLVTLEGTTLTTYRLGKVVLRAQSAAYPELYTDTVIEIKLWTDFSMFVRKIVGHFTLFAFLGMGYLVCCFFFLKRRSAAFVVAPLGVFSIAALTELLQFHIPGRYGMLYDVLINFCGGLAGMLAFIGVALVCMLVMRLCFREKFGYLKTALPKMSFEETFTRTIAPLEAAEPKKEECNETLEELYYQGYAEIDLYGFDEYV